MRRLEIRRHAMTKKGPARGRGSHLSAAGVALAREVGSTLGPMDLVVTSRSPRTIETAVAMGYAVDDAVDMVSGYVPGVIVHHDQWTWPRPYETYAELLADSPAVTEAARSHLDLWMRVLDSVGDGAGALIVSHGGSIELPLVAALPDVDRSAWGPPFAHCDGARLDFDGSSFTAVHLRRAPTGLTP